MMRTAELAKLAERFQIKFITIRDLQEYRKCHDHPVNARVQNRIHAGRLLSVMAARLQCHIQGLSLIHILPRPSCRI